MFRELIAAASQSSLVLLLLVKYVFLRVSSIDYYAHAQFLVLMVEC